VLSTVFNGQPGATLRLVREAAGLSLGALERRVYFSKSYLCNLERGKRRVTPAVVQSYLETLGDDVNRRQLLMTLLAAVGGSAPAEAVGRAFESALADPPLTVDDWLARLELYGREYMSLLGVGELQVRLAGDLAQLQARLDHPVLAAVAARLLTLHGSSVGSLVAPGGDTTGALRWYLLGVRAADRSGDVATRAWTRGRAAQALAFDGVDLPVAAGLANQALALSDRPSVGRLIAQLALALNRSRDGDRAGTLALLGDARRTLDGVGGDDGEVSDLAFPPWRVELMASLLASRLGDERLAQRAQDIAERAIPQGLPRLATQVELHRGLLRVKTGDREGGVAHAQDALAGLPLEGYRSSVRALMAEVSSASRKGA
jgi:transcriptional regulator with XRE-family HTH domain